MDDHVIIIQIGAGGDGTPDLFSVFALQGYQMVFDAPMGQYLANQFPPIFDIPVISGDLRTDQLGGVVVSEASRSGRIAKHHFALQGRAKNGDRDRIQETCNLSD
jgi:hypothetical protein